MTIEIPEHLRNGPLAEAAAKALADAASMASASNSVPRVSLRGREFRLIEGGEEVYKFRDNLDVIILGVEPDAGRMIKTWYKDGYKSGAKEPPTCASEDGIAPAHWINDKQATNCQSCPKNAFGSATSPSGKPTKACRDSKRAWFVLAEGNTPAGANSPVPVKPVISERTMYGLNVTVASLKAFSDHGKRLAQLGQGPAVCVTRLRMLDMEYPQLDFELHAWLSAQDAPQTLKLAHDRPWKIQYANAGLALAAPDSSGPKTTLPMQVPDHLRNVQVAPATDVPFKDAVNTVAANPAPTGNIDDQVNNW
jgi:hypothetical protein